MVQPVGGVGWQAIRQALAEVVCTFGQLPFHERGAFRLADRAVEWLRIAAGEFSIAPSNDDEDIAALVVAGTRRLEILTTHRGRRPEEAVAYRLAESPSRWNAARALTNAEPTRLSGDAVIDDGWWHTTLGNRSTTVRLLRIAYTAAAINPQQHDYEPIIALHWMGAVLDVDDDGQVALAHAGRRWELEWTKNLFGAAPDRLAPASTWYVDEEPQPAG